MDQQTMDVHLKLYQNILNKYSDEIQKLQSKQERLDIIEQDILSIKDNTTQILQLLKEQQEKKIQSLDKIKEIEHKDDVQSITELSDLRIVTGDKDGNIALFAIDDEKEQWTKIKEEKGHDDGIYSLCKVSGNRLVSSSWDKKSKCGTSAKTH